MFKKTITILMFVLFALALIACASSEPAAPAAESGGSGEAALKVTGLVDSEKAWTEDEIKAMPTMEAERANKEGTMETYTGVAINTLLEEAGVQSGATTLVMVADDGYEAEVPLADIQGCGNCIVSFRSQGGFSTVLPDFPGNVQVKGVIELKVK